MFLIPVQRSILAMPVSVSEADLCFRSTSKSSPSDRRAPPRVLVVLLGRLIRLARDDVGRARLVDEDGVDLVDDCVVEIALRALGKVARHVVAQVVEGEL